MTIKVIITMTSVAVGSGVAQKIFTSIGKVDEAQYLDLATKCGLGATALGLFAGFIKSLVNLG